MGRIAFQICTCTVTAPIVASKAATVCAAIAAMMVIVQKIDTYTSTARFRGST